MENCELLISIIILDWNGELSDCRKAIASAINQNYSNKEIIYVDNGSTTTTFNLLRSEYNQVKFFKTGVNLGCPRGRNWGAEKARGDILVFLENDGYWLDQNVISTISNYFSKYRLLGALYTSVKVPPNREKDPPADGMKSFGHTVDSISSLFRGGASSVRRSLFNKCGGFPDIFFRQGEEEWLSYRIYNAGFYILYVPSLELIHVGSNYKDKKNIISLYNVKNRLITKVRLLPFIDAFIEVVPRLIFRVIYFTVAGRPSDTKELVIAIIDALRARNKNELVSRSTVKKMRNIRRSQDAEVLNYSRMN